MSAHRTIAASLLLALLLVPAGAGANDYREKDKPVTVAKSRLMVKPPRDWNRLSITPGKNAETWTLDGEQLNEITFYAAVPPGKPLIRETSKKHKPLPRFTKNTLLIELPEVLEATYRTARGIGDFTVTGSSPDRFLGQDAIRFTYAYVDAEGLPRRGEARATIVRGQLYMMTFDAPRLHYYDHTVLDFRALSDTATL